MGKLGSSASCVIRFVVQGWINLECTGQHYFIDSEVRSELKG
jgi:hypothetical protein